MACEIAIRSHGTIWWEGTRLIPGVGRMPLYWTIDSKKRLFTGGGDGEVTLDDAMSLLEALAGAKALSYRKLFDGRAVQSSMTGEELLAVCAKIRTYHEQGPVGALAIVCTPEQTVTFARLWVHWLPPTDPSRCLQVCDKRRPGWAPKEGEAASLWLAGHTFQRSIRASQLQRLGRHCCARGAGDRPWRSSLSIRTNWRGRRET